MCEAEVKKFHFLTSAELHVSDNFQGFPTFLSNLDAIS